MDFDRFKTIIQTFGASPCRWETTDLESAVDWIDCEQGKTFIQEQKKIDGYLDLLQPPACPFLSEKIYNAVMNEMTQRQIFLFLRYSTLLSFLFMIGGFCLGWYQTQQDYINTQSYFTTLFNDITFQ